ncbi:acyltransferase [Paenibacillus piscarius]|uniref:acyltransferase n=1 Tax=Paenibacillus piscarius TaxID=1089681 RepID=UPI001EE91FA3|nr:N-acetyltransferase [Paenibacillus piscarius]
MSIHESARIGQGVQLGEYVVVEEGVVIGDKVSIGHHSIIKAGTKIGDRTVIGDLTILGKKPGANRKMSRKPALELPALFIEADVRIGSHVSVYAGSVIGSGVLIADHASIREQIVVGRDTILGRNVMVEPNTSIGSETTIQTGSYITADTVIEDQVFIGPCCSMSNDKYMASGKGHHQGPRIRRGARIGNNASLLPVEIGANAVVGAGAVVTKDVVPGAVVVGNPARLR